MAHNCNHKYSSEPKVLRVSIVMKGNTVFSQDKELIQEKTLASSESKTDFSKYPTHYSS